MMGITAALLLFNRHSNFGWGTHSRGTRCALLLLTWRAAGAFIKWTTSISTWNASKRNADYLVATHLPETAPGRGAGPSYRPPPGSRAYRHRDVMPCSRFSPCWTRVMPFASRPDPLISPQPPSPLRPTGATTMLQ